jgi:hypothetical protein
MTAPEQGLAFEVSGSELSFVDVADLVQKLGQIDTDVPQRTRGRRSHHRERFCIVRYLGSLASSGLLTFPLRVVKWESPDFLIHQAATTIGLEITEASTEKHQQAATLLEKSPPGTLLEGEADLRKPDEELRGRGYVGDEVERELAGLILHAIEVKAAKINQPHFAHTDRYDLLIYDNSHLAVMAEFRDLAPKLREQLAERAQIGPGPRYFSEISVLSDSYLLYDVAARSSLLPVVKNNV